MMREEAKQNSGKIPRHVAIIMDGNGRWAKEAGCNVWLVIVQAPKICVRSSVSAEFGIKYLTFMPSTENLVAHRRSHRSDAHPVEVIDQEIDELNREGARLVHIGHLDGLSEVLQKRFALLSI